MADQQGDQSMSLTIKILPPDPSAIPPAVFSNHLFASRQQAETWLVFTHIRAPIGAKPSAEQTKRLAEEGATPSVVASIVIPNTLIPNLIAVLEKMVPGGIEPKEETVQ